MHFVRTEDLKTGMRLARPVYNKKSILLFDRNSLLSLQAIESIRNFGLIGVYVLEPAEPLPPLTQEDLEFERFQIQAVSAIEEEQDRILKTRKQNRTQSIADMVIRNYGHLDEKINFYQNLRSREDYFSRHSLNVAILCAMVTHVMNIRREEQYHTVCAAILHDMGKVKNMMTCITGHLIPERICCGTARRRKRPTVSSRRLCHRRIRHPQDLPTGSQKTAGPVPGRRREEQV